MKRRSAFTLIELLVVIAIIALLVSILMPSLQKAKELAKSVVCASHQKNVSLAIFLYAQQYDDCFPYNLDTLPVPGDNFPPDVTWAVRVGKIDEYEMPDHFPGTEHERIALEGFIDYHWWIRHEGSFKCAAAFDQIDGKQPYPLFDDDTKSAGWGNCFTANSGVMRGAKEIQEGDQRLDANVVCTKLDDVRIPSILIADGHSRQSGGSAIAVTFRVNNKGRLGSSNASQSDREMVEQWGPWPQQTTQTSWSPNSYRVDYYGHPGERANLTRTDGSVNSEQWPDPDDWKIR